MIEPGPPSAKAMRLSGAAGWRGRAVGGYEKFSFDALPWVALEREGERRGGAELAKASRSRKVFRLAGAGRAGETLYAKRYLLNNFRRRVSARLTGPKAEREFELGRRARELGVPTPEPLAFAYHFASAKGVKGEPLPPASYLLTREWPNAGSMAEWARAKPEATAGMWLDLAAFLGEVHAAGFYHDDLAADHILVGAGGDGPACGAFGLIDLDNGRIYPGGVPLRQRQVNLFQILRSVGSAGFSKAQRREFVGAYLAATDLHQGLSPKQMAETVNGIAQRKIGRRVV